MKNIKIRQFQNRALILMSVIFFSVLALVTGNIAAQQTKGMVQNGAYQLAVDGTTALYWVIFGVSCLMVLATVWLLVLSLTSKRETIVSKPSSLSSTQRLHTQLSQAAIRRYFY